MCNTLFYFYKIWENHIVLDEAYLAQNTKTVVEATNFSSPFPLKD